MSMKPLLTNHVDRNLTTVVTGAKYADKHSAQKF